jgi:ketosteroid isomerase-like protein
MTPDEIARRLRRLEDVEAIRALKARYCLAVDERDEEAWAALFTADAVWDGGEFGRYQGRAAIRAFFRDIPRTLSFAVHYVTNPLVEVDGDRARGTWYLLEPCTFTDGARGVLGAARYDERYVREGDGWKFAEVLLRSWFWTPYPAGWRRRPDGGA